MFNTVRLVIVVVPSEERPETENEEVVAFVNTALVENRFVEVADVDVESVVVRFVIVEEAELERI